MANDRGLKIFHRLCLTLVVYTVLVIIWGAWVRISHSGDGCGNHWPLCEGAFIPTNPDQKTLIEYFHRLSSGFYGIFVAGLAFAAFRIFPPGTGARKAALTTFFLMVIEALLGAALVLKGLVGQNATVFRLVVMTLHQVNSLLLVGSTVVWAVAVNQKVLPFTFNFSWKKLFSAGAFALAFILIPASGAWAALANTLFPSFSLAEGLAQDFSAGTPWILKLRVLHPIVALSLGIYLIFKFYKKSENATDPLLKQASLQVAAVFAIAMIFGILTLLFLSPVWMKLVHLTMAQVVWISLVHYVMISLLSTKR